ncbi:MAG: hypothetical protein K2Q22_10655, partial [Cytophagales bacterium]|nr:hypothetical protein [Cytophagales bacterium]
MFKTAISLLLTISTYLTSIAQNSVKIGSVSYPNIQSAINAASVAGTIIDVDGYFNENILISNKYKLVIRNAPGKKAILDGGTTITSWTPIEGGSFYLATANYVSYSNIT